MITITQLKLSPYYWSQEDRTVMATDVKYIDPSGNKGVARRPGSYDEASMKQWLERIWRQYNGTAI